MVKTIEGIKLAGNAYTFILYKNYFGRDLLNDIVAFAKKNAGGNLSAFIGKDFNNLTESEKEELLSLDYNFDTEFILQFVSSLIATARYPEKPDIVEVITGIPPHWLADQSIVGELMEFLSLFIPVKKGGTAAASGNSFR